MCCRCRYESFINGTSRDRALFFCGPFDGYYAMSKGVNKVILIGNLGADPETRYTPSNTAVTHLRLATSESWKDKQNGENKEQTEWHRVVMFGRLAEIAAEYTRKGSKVYIEGRIQTQKWQDKQGNDRYTTEIVAGQMQMLDSRGSSPLRDESSEYKRPEQKSAPDFDEDVPF